MLVRFQPPDTLSYWERETFFRHLDVAIVGSGIVGLTAAIRLKELQPNLRVAVLERGTLPFGASTRNAGFACFGSMTELLDDLSTQSAEAVWSLVEQRWRGLRRLRERVGEKRLQYEALGGYELFRTEEEAVFRECCERMEVFNQAVQHITGQAGAFQVADARLRDFGFKSVNHLIVNRLEGQLHAGKMIEALLQIAAHCSVILLNGIEIQSVETSSDRITLHTPEGWEIQANKVLAATNGFARQLFPHLTVQPARNQVLITQPVPNLLLRGAFHYDRGYFYFRNVEGRILLGGGRHLALQTEQTADFGTTTLIREALLSLLQEVILPERDIAVDTWWSGILGVGEQKRPIIEEAAPNIWVAVRLGGMGVAIGSLVGETAAEKILQ